MIWHHNAYGHWCPTCGDRVGRASAEPDSLPDQCRQCGFPDAEKVASYMFDDDDSAEQMDEDEEFLSFTCGMMPDGICMLAGTEECDWECPRS